MPDFASSLLKHHIVSADSCFIVTVDIFIGKKGCRRLGIFPKILVL